MKKYQNFPIKMEVSDDDEEIIELNELQTNSKTINNQEKNTSKS